MDILLTIFSLLLSDVPNTERTKTSPPAVYQDQGEAYASEDREVALNRFFARFNSPWEGQGNEFVAIADKYSLDYRLIPTIGGVESSLGKNCSGNCFGWANGKKDCGTDLQDAECVAEGISRLSYYARFRETGSLRDFAFAYNKVYAESYYSKLVYFYEKLTQ